MGDAVQKRLRLPAFSSILPNSLHIAQSKPCSRRNVHRIHTRWESGDTSPAIATGAIISSISPSSKGATLETWHILVMAVVQGIAEFLPISSSGHLVIVAAMLGHDSAAGLDLADVNIVLHLGTLGSILCYYWREFLQLLTKDRRVVPLLILGTIPAAVCGVVIKKKFEGLLESAPLAGCMLLVTGAVLLLAHRLPNGKRKYAQTSMLDALRIGIAQAFALLPGISRSGVTIAAGLAHGLERREAAAFSFLLAIPAIAGASLLEFLDILSDKTLSSGIPTLLLGAVVAFVVGLVALRWLIAWLDRGRFQWFGIWCILVGLGVLIWKWPF